MSAGRSAARARPAVERGSLGLRAAPLGRRRARCRARLRFEMRDAPEGALRRGGAAGSPRARSARPAARTAAATDGAQAAASQAGWTGTAGGAATGVSRFETAAHTPTAPSPIASCTATTAAIRRRSRPRRTSRATRDQVGSTGTNASGPPAAAIAASCSARSELAARATTSSRSLALISCPPGFAAFARRRAGCAAAGARETGEAERSRRWCRRCWAASADDRSSSSHSTKATRRSSGS